MTEPKGEEALLVGFELIFRKLEYSLSKTTKHFSHDR